MGFFGKNAPTKKGAPAQPRWFFRVDAAEAHAAAAPYIDRFLLTLSHPNAPLYSGGVFDSWPAIVVDALDILRAEWHAIEAFRSHERMNAHG